MHVVHQIRIRSTIERVGTPDYSNIQSEKRRRDEFESKHFMKTKNEGAKKMATTQMCFLNSAPFVLK